MIKHKTFHCSRTYKNTTSYNTIQYETFHCNRIHINTIYYCIVYKIFYAGAVLGDHSWGGIGVVASVRA